ncbi:hypothetical protein [Planktothricoides raciborskii]|uniref:Uncharacterized protein n=1 Tax=Planktothricoides raciborskii GIHE-MW2 TaxID=2792601 RepID=A0AAU8JGA7_9CYAN
MFDWLFKPYRQHKILRNIDWIESQTERYFSAPLEQVQAEHKEVVTMAKEAQVRGKLAGEIYQGLGDIESAKLAANTEGIKVLEQVQQRRQGYRSMRGRLIKGS